MSNFKFNIIVWFSLIIIAFIIASIDVMSSKIIVLTPDKETMITKIVFNDVWYKMSILLFLMPALFSYYINRKWRKSIFIIIAGMVLIFFGLEDLFYFVIKSIVVSNDVSSLSSIYPNLFTKIGFVNYIPNGLYWLNNSVISLFGSPVTPYVLLESTAFALVLSFILVII